MENLKIKYPEEGAKIVSGMSEKDSIECMTMAEIFAIFLGKEKEKIIRDTVGELIEKGIVQVEGVKFFLTPRGYKFVEEEKAKAEETRN